MARWNGGTGRSALLVGEGSRCSVKLCKVNGKLLIECLRLVLKDADGGGLTEQHRHGGVAAPVVPRMDAVTEAVVVRELVQFAVYREVIPVRAGIRYEGESILCRHQWIGNHEITVEEKLQNGNASAGDNTVAGGIRRVRGRAFGKGL